MLVLVGLVFFLRGGEGASTPADPIGEPEVEAVAPDELVPDQAEPAPVRAPVVLDQVAAGETVASAEEVAAPEKTPTDAAT